MNDGILFDKEGNIVSTDNDEQTASYYKQQLDTIRKIKNDENALKNIPGVMLDREGNIVFTNGYEPGTPSYYRHEIDLLKKAKNMEYDAFKDPVTGESRMDYDAAITNLEKQYQEALEDEAKNGPKYRNINDYDAIENNLEQKYQEALEREGQATTNSTEITQTGPTSDVLKVNEENINSFINQIDTSIDILNSTWNNLVMTDVQIINDSWASNDARTYVDKLMAEGDKISDTVQALKLLEETYKKVINESTATGQDVSGSVGRL